MSKDQKTTSKLFTNYPQYKFTGEVLLYPVKGNNEKWLINFHCYSLKDDVIKSHFEKEIIPKIKELYSETTNKELNRIILDEYQFSIDF